MNSQRDSRYHVALRSPWHNSPQGSGWNRMVCYSVKWSSTMWLACYQWPTAACSAHECVPSGRGASSSPLCHPSCRSLCREQYLTHSLQMRSEVEETSITLCFSPESTYTHTQACLPDMVMLLFALQTQPRQYREYSESHPHHLSPSLVPRRAFICGGQHSLVSGLFHSYSTRRIFFFYETLCQIHGHMNSKGKH